MLSDQVQPERFAHANLLLILSDDTDFTQIRTRKKMTEKSRKHLLRRASDFYKKKIACASDRGPTETADKLIEQLDRRSKHGETVLMLSSQGGT